LELRAAAGVVEREVGGAGSVAVAMGIRSRREEGRAVVVGPATGTCRSQEEDDGNVPFLRGKPRVFLFCITFSFQKIRFYIF
jgi:hypothetical protein